MCIILTRVWYSISSVVHPAPYAPVLILLLDSLSLHLLQFPFHSVSSCRIDHRNGSALHLTSLFVSKLSDIAIKINWTRQIQSSLSLARFSLSHVPIRWYQSGRKACVVSHAILWLDSIYSNTILLSMVSTAIVRKK